MGTGLIEFKNVRKRYGKKSKDVLKQISFCASEGEIIGVLGKNGEGKTTLIKCMLRLLSIDDGEIIFDGENVNTIKTEYYYKKIAAVLEGDRNLYWFLSGYENILYYGRLKNIPDSIIREQADLYLKRFKLFEDKDKKVSHYSRGMQQKLSIIISLLGEPKVLLLDEPTLGLDVQTKAELITCLKELVKERNITIFITSHQLDVIEKMASRLILLQEGKIAYDGNVMDFKCKYSKEKYQITIRGKSDLYLKENYAIEDTYDSTIITIMGENSRDVMQTVATLIDQGYDVISFNKDTSDLEDILLSFYKDGAEELC